MLWAVFREHWPDARLLLLTDEARARPNVNEKLVRFAVRAGSMQALGQTDWILFSHLGLAAVQRAMPRQWRHGTVCFFTALKSGGH